MDFPWQGTDLQEMSGNAPAKSGGNAPTSAGVAAGGGSDQAATLEPLEQLQEAAGGRQEEQGRWGAGKGGGNAARLGGAVLREEAGEGGGAGKWRGGGGAETGEERWVGEFGEKTIRLYQRLDEVSRLCLRVRASSSPLISPEPFDKRST